MAENSVALEEEGRIPCRPSGQVEPSAEDLVYLEEVSAPRQRSESTEPSAEYSPNHPATTANFVFVHGLNPRSRSDFARYTWTHANGNFWPTTQLGQLAPSSRVFLYSYNSRVAWDVSINGVEQHANDLLVRLSGKRAGEASGLNSRPIVFVAHSLGGLVVKEALIIAKNNDSFRKIREATTSLVFFAVPHHGGRGTSLGTIAQNIVTAVNGEKRNDLLRSLEKNSLFQKHQGKLFRQQLEDYQILTVVEDLPTVLKKVLSRKISKIIVDATAATLGLVGPRETVVTLNANHSDVCRFAGDDAKFEAIKDTLGQFAKLPTKRNQPVHEPVRYLRFPPNPQFVGRDSQLAELQERLLGNDDCPRVALHGLGGVGKTQIALKFAYQIQKTLPDCSILWISAISTETVQQAYTAIARRFDISIPADEEAQAANYVHEYLSCDIAGRWLMIVDNVDTRDVLLGTDAASKQNLASYLPYNKKGSILCTTRSREVATALAGSQVILVDELLPIVAWELLSKSLIDPKLLSSRNERDAASELLKDLVYLPLAITQAAAYINSVEISLSTYLGLIRDTEDSLIQTLSRDFSDENRYPESKNPVAATWLVSFQQIQRENPLAAKVLSFFSCVEPVGIPESLVPEDLPRESVIYAIGKLRTFSFISQGEDQCGYNMHRLVHLAARSWLRIQKHAGDIQMLVIRRLHAVFPDPRFENKELRDRLFPHAQKILDEYIGFKTIDWWQLCMKTGYSLELEGRVKEAVDRYSQAEAWTRVALAEDHPSRLASQHMLASAYDTDGQVGRAIELLEHVVTVQEVLAEDHPNRLKSQHELASVYHTNGQAGRAIEILEHVVTVQEVLAEDHPNRLTSQHALASVYHTNGQAGRAIEILEHVVKVREALAEDHPSRLASQHALASVYHTNGQADRAIEILEHVVKVREALAEDHPDRLASQHALAVAYWRNGQVGRAIEILEHVVKLREALAEDHPDRLASQHALAVAYWRNGQVGRAIEILEHVVKLREALAEDHPDRLASQHELARAYNTDGQVGRAIDLLEHVVKVREALAEDHPDRLASQNVLAIAYQSNSRADEAVKILDNPSHRGVTRPS